LAASLIRSSATNVAPILVGGALMVIAIAAGIIIVLLMKSNSFDATESAVAQLGAQSDMDKSLNERFAQFCENYGLTGKESEVIQPYSQGRSVRYISSELHVSESTVRTHLQRVYLKLDIHNRQELLDGIAEYSKNVPENENL
jgi:DNA-binding NarL/FixJ family response regulator